MESAARARSSFVASTDRGDTLRQATQSAAICPCGIVSGRANAVIFDLNPDLTRCACQADDAVARLAVADHVRHTLADRPGKRGLNWRRQIEARVICALVTIGDPRRRQQLVRASQLG